jgi:hypothetical protein
MKLCTSSDEDPRSPNYPIKISDLANMFRRKSGRNDRPYDAKVHELNNKKVDIWYHDVLQKIADANGCIPVGRAPDCLRYFTEGLETIQYQKYKRYMPRYTEEEVQFWLEFLSERSVEELHEAGITVVSAAWNCILGAVRNHFADIRYELVYSKSENPAEWDKLANMNPHPMHGRPLPFGISEDILKEMEAKVMVILGNPLQPKA